VLFSCNAQPEYKAPDTPVDWATVVTDSRWNYDSGSFAKGTVPAALVNLAALQVFSGDSGTWSARIVTKDGEYEECTLVLEDNSGTLSMGDYGFGVLLSRHNGHHMTISSTSQALYLDLDE